MNCVACGSKILIKKCSNCGLDYSREMLCFVAELNDFEIKALNSIFKKTSVTKPLTPPTVQMSYDDYMFELENMCRRSKPTDFEIEEFIEKNKLDLHYGITINDVKTDINSITIKHIRSNHAACKASKNINTEKGLSYEYYLSELRNWYRSSNISDFHLENYIKTNKLDVLYGITVRDVKTTKNVETADMQKKIRLRF